MGQAVLRHIKGRVAPNGAAEARDGRSSAMASSAALDGGEEYKEGSSGNTGETRWLGSRGPLTVTMSACCSKMSTATCLRPRMPKSAGASMAGHAYLSAESYVECTGLVGEARDAWCEGC